MADPLDIDSFNCDQVVKSFVDFIDGSLAFGVSVLLFSTRGRGRNIVATCAYLMYKYGWSFEKAYDFIYNKKPDIEINRGFVQQMFALEKRSHILCAYTHTFMY